ncbi:MAG: class II aldolase/adducin family protein [Candidatus Hydrogenedentes bacterium]|nr:class II aldolase/adducin family protein [Candidatus Hydrogenedentota bacterium]
MEDLSTDAWNEKRGFSHVVRRLRTAALPSAQTGNFSETHCFAVDLEDGKVAQGALRPSSDTATHLALYKAFPGIGAVTHTHSHYATCWAQACRAIPCLGTTHADHFYGDVPVTEPLSSAEIAEHYERNTGEVIVRRFAKLDPLHYPGVLVANHAPFTWGETIEKAVENAAVLEEIARMALHTLMISPNQSAIGQTLLDKHFLRKHGTGAYYGQSTEKP